MMTFLHWWSSLSEGFATGVGILIFAAMVMTAQIIYTILNLVNSAFLKGKKQ